ncbi:MAG: RNA polymerase factor sigma-32 [Alphaproteobacteria bacterium]|nr:RNA polymerase factor sigma-32 [Alphaproteobacteria bacterium]
MSKEIKSTLPAQQNYYLTGFGGNNDSSLAKYISEIQKFPILSAEEEYNYAKKWVTDHDEKAAEQLIGSHLRLVVKTAYGFANYGLPVSELITSGNMGLMEALQKFDPDKGTRFSTYSSFWIKAEIYDYILDNWSLVKIGSSANKKKVFFNLTRAKRDLGIFDNHLSDEQVAKLANHLGVSEDDIKEISNRMALRDYSLDKPLNSDSDSSDVLSTIEDTSIPSIQETLEEHEFKTKGLELLRKHLNELSERDREIFVARRLSDPALTLETLSQKYNISRERVRQIEERAYKKISTAILNDSTKKISG